MSSVSAARQAIAYLRDLAKLVEQADWSIPPEPEHVRSGWPRPLDWRPSQQLAPLPEHSLEQVQQDMMTYATRHARLANTAGLPVLLVKAPPGVGKTHLAVRLVQELAADGYRILYCGARHDHFDTLRQYPHFDPRLWYEWLPIHECQGEHDRIPTTCRYAGPMRAWLQRGYPSTALCRELCVYDRWLRECPYRQQRKRKERIIYAMHQHLVHGTSIRRYDLCIVDELPLNAFVRERHIPVSGIRIDCSDPLRSLLVRLWELAQQAEQPVRERPLLDAIGDLLTDVYQEIQVRDDVLPAIPRVYSPNDVHHKPYFYVPHLLRLLQREWEAWRHGWPHWVSRVSASKHGLLLLDRAEVWQELPHRVIVLDATGRPEIYEQIFQRPVEVYEPRVQRPGRIYQIVGRLNGAGAVLEGVDDDGDGAAERRRLTRHGRELLEIAQQIASRYRGRVGVVTFKAARDEFATVFGEGNVLHFGDLRGSNQLMDVECLIVAGGYAPPARSVMEVAAALWPDRIKPFGAEDEQGRFRPVYTTRECEYRLIERSPQYAEHHGQVAVRAVKGYWDDPELNAVHEQLREAELTQAIHRARPNVRECDVWVLTSIPTGELLDGVWEDLPPMLTGAPEGIHWRTWQRITAWLAEQRPNVGDVVTAEDLAAAAEASVASVKRLNWLDRIVECLPDQWRLVRLGLSDRRGGRPRIGIERYAPSRGWS